MDMTATSSRTPIRLDRSKPAAAQVFERLHQSIIGLELRPGEVLSRSDLAERFGVSSTPVRDALLRLEEERLVEVYPQHATMVSRIDPSLVRQAHFLRRSVELEVVRTLALRPDRGFAAELDELLDRQGRLIEAGELDELALADAVFHRRLCDEARVSDLWTLVRRQSGHLDRLRRLHLPIAGKARKVLDDHRRILDAIRRGDGNAAAALMREHLSGTLDSLDQLRERFPDHFLPPDAIG